MKILFAVRNLWYVKIFESVLREAARRGHTVHVAVERGEGHDRLTAWNAAAQALTRDHPSITFGPAPKRIGDPWLGLAIYLRLSLDYLRFLDARYRNAPRLLSRAAERTPRLVLSLARMRLLSAEVVRRALTFGLGAAERSIPVNGEMIRYLRAQAPDIVLFSPLITIGSTELDLLHAAKAVGLRTALCVGSWDHLSSKALLRTRPGSLLLWNDTQRTEAIELHGMPPDRIVVTGAQCFDQWFERTPSSSREDFCRRAGLAPDRPFILYVCSSLFDGSPSEPEFVTSWLERVRSHADPGFGHCGILIRPHPKRWKEWERVDLSRHANVSVWPRGGAAPFDTPTKDDYFESLFYSAAVVGLNTSALIEGGILGRAVHTILLPEFQENQEGTLHFHYLLNLEGGLLHSARSVDLHLVQLAHTLAHPQEGAARSHAFVERFVRPAGMDVAATGVFLDAVERLAEQPALAADVAPVWARLVRAVTYPAARRLMHVKHGEIDEALREARRYGRTLAKASEADVKARARAARLREKAQKKGIKPREERVSRGSHA